jgi:hypothetical protein
MSTDNTVSHAASAHDRGHGRTPSWGLNHSAAIASQHPPRAVPVRNTLDSCHQLRSTMPRALEP